MDFREATEQLSKLGVDVREQAQALGIAYQTIRLMRMDSTASGYRTPPAPEKWRPVLAELARNRAAALVDYSKAVKR
jgi:hypothetical protein